MKDLKDLLRRFCQEFSSVTEATIASCAPGLTLQQVRILMEIHGDTVATEDLAFALDLSDQELASELERLGEMGLVSNFPLDFEVELVDQGLDLSGKISRLILDQYKDEKITIEDISELERYLDQIQEALSVLRIGLKGQK